MKITKLPQYSKVFLILMKQIHYNELFYNLNKNKFKVNN